MKYTIEYLKKQLEETTKVRDDLSAILKADPNNFALGISVSSMNNHIKEIQRDLDETYYAHLVEQHGRSTVTAAAIALRSPQSN